MRNLWDFIPRRPERPRSDTLTRSRWKPPAAPAPKPAPRRRTAPTMQERYEALTREMLARYRVRVRKWRSGMTGVAWQVTYSDGSVARLIEAPRPRGPMSAAVFLHEIGHHAIGFNRYKLRCVEEYHAWRFAIETMEACNLNVTDAVRRRMRDSLAYAVDKARRRGLREIPPELVQAIRPVRTGVRSR